MVSDRFTKNVLVLNSDFQPLTFIPLSTTKWEEAIKMVLMNDATILEYIDNVYIRSEKIRIHFPTVIILNKFIKYKQKVKLTRTNIFIRDLYTCCFCNKYMFFERENLTVDHIIPRSKGGKSCWENLVSSCKDCNTIKGDMIIIPRKIPKEPSYSELVYKRKNLPVFIDHESWRKYLIYSWEENKILSHHKPENYHFVK